jgi:hypothetical protein
MKDRPDFPQRFYTIGEARAFVIAFMDWYNNEHHHSGIALLTPADLALLPGGGGHHPAPGCARCRLSGPSGTFREQTTGSSRSANRRLDQRTCSETRQQYSINFFADCLISR